MEMLTIPQFFHKKDILVTGATGLIGKVLIEKLLRSCPTLGRIFIIVRNKKGLTGEERVRIMTDTPLFEKLRSQNEKFLKKIIPLEGDVKELRLGMSDEDIVLLKNVSVIFNVAASVRFNDKLQDAILLNTRSTRELLEIALGMDRLKAIVQVSTMYSNPMRSVVEEKLHESHFDWQKAIEIASKVNDDIFETLTPHFSDHYPNTYTFTKGLAEQVCESYKDRLPIIIYRPAIVSGSREDPIAGWCDSFNGLSGMLVAGYSGILRYIYCNENSSINLIPVDDCVRGMIVASWKIGSMPQKKNDLTFYNCTSPIIVTWNDAFKSAKDSILESPFTSVLWAPSGTISSYRSLNWLNVMIKMVFPAIIVDYFLRQIGKKPFLLNIQRRIFIAIEALSYFIVTKWNFRTDQFIQLHKDILDSDIKDFDFMVMKYDTLHFINIQVLGIRRYLLKEDDSTIPAARRRMKFLIIFAKLMNILWYGTVMYLFTKLILFKYIQLIF